MSEKMEENWENDVIRLVFKYLNRKELHNAYLVCKSWWEIGKSVNEERGPLCVTIIGKKTEENENVVSTIENIIRLLVLDPSFCMIMTNDTVTYDNSENCHCTLLPYNCFSIRLENIALKSDITLLSSIIFPDTTNIQISNFTFDCQSSSMTCYCPEMYQSYHNCFLRCYNLGPHFDRFLKTERASTCCLILWSNQYKFEPFAKFVRTLAEWYPESEVVAWGGVSDNIIICNKKIDTYRCRKNVDFGIFFINGQDMDTKSLVLDENCATTKLIAENFRLFSESTILKEHSIGFMYTSYLHLDDFYELESFLFKQYFPNVQLIHTVGKEPFGGVGFNELLYRAKKILFEESSIHTALMILTYN